MHARAWERTRVLSLSHTHTFIHTHTYTHTHTNIQHTRTHTHVMHQNRDSHADRYQIIRTSHSNTQHTKHTHTHVTLTHTTHTHKHTRTHIMDQIRDSHADGYQIMSCITDRLSFFPFPHFFLFFSSLLIAWTPVRLVRNIWVSYHHVLHHQQVAFFLHWPLCLFFLFPVFSLPPTPPFSFSVNSTRKNSDLQTCDITHSYVWHSRCNLRDTDHMCDTTHSDMWHDSFLRVIRVIF